MKILYHHRTLGDGAEGIHIHEMIEAWRGLGNEVRVVSLVGEYAGKTPPQSKRWNIIRRLIPSSAYELAELGYNLIGTRRVLRTIREFQPDFIYDRYNSYNTAALHAARRAGLPILLEFNAPVVYERTAYAYMQLKFPWLARRYEKMICLGADHIFTVSTALKTYLIQERGVYPEKISVLPNAINPDQFISISGGEEIRDRYCLNEQIVVGFVGTLRAWHGIDLLMQVIPEVVSNHTRVHFLIVGRGELEQTFRQYIQEIGLHHKVTFVGWVPHDEVPAYIAAMDITLMPNSNFYGSPIKVFEYMAVGKPTIAPRLGPLEEVIEHGVNGILIKPGSKEELKDAIIELLNDPQKRQQIGRQAREIVFANYTWTKNAEQVIIIYNRLVPA